MKFFIIIFTISVHSTSGNDYFTSPAAIQKLINVEQQLLSAISSYATVLEKRLEKVKEYLDDYENSILGGKIQNENFQNGLLDLNNSDDMKEVTELSVEVSSHPLKSYRLIRRFVIQLQNLEQDVANQEEKKFLNVIEKIRKGIRFPQPRDVDGSIEGLLRVQDAYDLNITEFTSGTFQGLETNSPLTASDCYQVGMYAYEAQIHTRAIEWLQRAFVLVTQENDTTMSPETIAKDLEAAIAQHDEALNEDPTNIYIYRHPIESLQNLLSQPNIRLEKVADEREYVLYQEQENIHDLYNFAALCSGKILQVESQKKSLTCIQKPTAGVPILTQKIEFLHTNPEVIQVHDVLGEATVANILDMATPAMMRSKVQGAAWEEQHSNTRTSTSAWIQETVDERLRAINERIQELSGLVTLRPNAAEDLQISSYGIGGHYNPHLDLLFEDYVPGPEERIKGDRIATFLFYLSDVARGGGTAFPRLGILAQPVKGSAIFWYNLRTDGTTDPLSLHGGCPVLYGTKHVANKWIRANAQFRARKCPRESLDQNRN